MKILFIASCVLMLGCNTTEKKAAGSITTNPSTEPVFKELVFDKIVGTWLSEDGKSFERWTKSRDEYHTAGFSVKGNDTAWNEQGRVYKVDENWVFENTVANQNDGKAVRFVSSLLTDQSVQFSNPAHDFPTDINYTIADANTLKAFIVGPNQKGGKDTIPFNFTRVQ